MARGTNTDTAEEATIVDEGNGSRVPAVVAAESRAVSRMDDAQRAEVVRFLETIQIVSDADPEEVALEIIGRVLSAQTVEEILAEPRVVGARTMLGVPVILRDVRFSRSDYEGTGGYALLDVVDTTNDEAVLVTCGAFQVMAQAYKLAAIGALPVPVVIRETQKATRGGYHPMFLRLPAAAQVVDA